jgi:hypothetical protein
MTALRRLVQDLRDAVRPRALERVTMNVNGLVIELAETMREEAQRAGLALEAARSARRGFATGRWKSTSSTQAPACPPIA